VINVQITQSKKPLRLVLIYGLGEMPMMLATNRKVKGKNDMRSKSAVLASVAGGLKSILDLKSKALDLKISGQNVEGYQQYERPFILHNFVYESHRV
jgi:hypothetical protein